MMICVIVYEFVGPQWVGLTMLTIFLREQRENVGEFMTD